MRLKAFCMLVMLSFIGNNLGANENAKLFMKLELSFTSDKTFANPLYDVKDFHAIFTAPSGRKIKINGFWDGGNSFKIRFAPDETGTWSYQTYCNDESNKGLHNVNGSFKCIPNNSNLEIYKRGPLIRHQGTYHIAYGDGRPFLWIACTAWNGALKSTEGEWDTYLQHRVDHNYSVIQFVTTQWRGCDKNSKGETAYGYENQLTVNPSFFQHLDTKVDKINEFGLVAAPVLLWALPFGQGRHLSPGYVLPLEEAVMLAKYIIARYQGNQVVWVLGGDGRYAHEYEQRWLEIGRRTFADNPPGLVAQHPHGRLWIGDNHSKEEWLDIVGYQSSHSNQQGTVDWINKGPIATRWNNIPAKPIINLEPNYEEIHNTIDDEDVRNASYWSIFATPVAGITYGANGIWPWIREGEKILNHGQPDHVSTWRQSIDFPGSIQTGYLAEFMNKLPWWHLRPANDLLADQPGDQTYNHFISVSKTIDNKMIVAYLPHPSTITLHNTQKIKYTGQWYNPGNNTYTAASLISENGTVQATSPGDGDYLLLLKNE